MNYLAICLFAVIGVVFSAPLEAEKYPAGLSPSLCPGYPICDNSLVHGTPPVDPFVPAPLPVAPLPPFPLIGAREWPAGVHPSSCPSYPFCNSVSQIVMPLPGFTERLYPPGVHPSACPNYPEC